MNKHILIFFICLGLNCFNGIQTLAQTDSVKNSSKAYRRILGDVDLSVGKIRGFILGDSIAVILRSEKTILEAQGDDFLFYRVLCDSILSAEISYTFDEKGLLISIGIEFFESCLLKENNYLSDEFIIHLHGHYHNCIENGDDYFECNSAMGMHIDYQKQKSEMCLIHTQIEFY